VGRGAGENQLSTLPEQGGAGCYDAVVRGHIRRAGQSTRVLRGVLMGCVLAPMATLCVFPFLGGDEPPGWLLRLSSGIGPALLVVLPFVVALPTALIYRNIRRVALRRALVQFPRSRRAEILAPLRRDAVHDTRQLAVALCSDLRLPTELTPATAPGAHGDEARPAEWGP